jgi:hypothetical protein
VYKWLRRGFGLVIGFINNLEVVATINYYTITVLQNVQSLHTNLFRLTTLASTGLQHVKYNSLTERHTPNITNK